jgi:ABC-type sugar transport system ATPase subunit
MIVVENLTKSYGQNLALKGVTLEVQKGEILAVIGPSGCGKSTLLRLIAGLERPDNGTVSIEGVTFSSNKQMAAPQLRNVAMIFQDLALWPHMTAESHLKFVFRYRNRKQASSHADIHELLTAVGLNGHSKRYPYELSGGEQQRLAIARALAQVPSYLLMDEPFSNLDAMLKEDLENVIGDLKVRLNVGIVYVTHHAEDLLRVADRVAVMEGGELRQIGKKEEVIKQPRDEFVKKILGIGRECT